MQTGLKLKKWPLVSRLFHWVSVILLVIVWSLFVLYENSDNVFYINLHKAFGLSLLCWMLARLINRLLTRAPQAIAMPKWQDWTARLVHLGLYTLLIAMPMAGLLMTVYAGYPVSVFGLLHIPVFVTPNPEAASFYKSLHTGVIWSLILAFTGVHIVAALYHQLVKKDKLINRML